MKPISIDDIRAKFPMYSDVSDENLVLAVRRQFYPDIPLKDFVSRVEFKAPNPTEGMSTGELALSGVGKAFTDVGRGLGQMVGLVDRQDVAESRKRDAALMDTTAGKVGNIGGNVAALAPTAFIPGAATLAGAAAIGGGIGLTAPSASTEETLKNTGFGAALGPASVLVGRGLGAAARGGKSLLEPFTKKGQDAIAARTLQQFADDPAQAAARLRGATELVPGSRPTMAQAADDAGLAQLERVIGNNPETGGILAAHKAAQRTARLNAVQDIAGTDDFYNGIKDGIRQFAKEDYAKAIAEGFDPAALTKHGDRLASVLGRPSIKSAQSTAKRLAEESGEQLTDAGSVKGLDYLVKALDNKISIASNPGSSIGKADLRALVGTKEELLNILDDVAPAYKAARSNFAAMSKQKNSMDVARDLLGRMESPLGRYGADTREMKNAYARALEQSTESVKKQIGMNVPMSKVMNQKDIRTLDSVARDMGRAAKADDLGRAVGSNTAQNLAAQNLLRRTLGPTGLPQSWAESNVLQAFLSPYTGVAKLAGSERAVLDRILKAALDPADAGGLLMRLQQPEPIGLLGTEAMRYLPGAGASGLLGYSP